MQSSEINGTLCFILTVHGVHSVTRPAAEVHFVSQPGRTVLGHLCLPRGEPLALLAWYGALAKYCYETSTGKKCLCGFDCVFLV